MRIQLDSKGPSNVVRSYESGRIVINDTDYVSSLVVLPDRIVADWPPQSFDSLNEEHFGVLARLDAEIVLLGTGATLQFPAPTLLRPLVEAGRGFEIMDTGAACRTYNVLTSEGRRVAAALLMIRD